MPFKVNTERMQHWACCLLAASIPFPFLYSSIGVWLLAAVWLFGGRFKYVPADFRQYKPALWLIVFFMLHVVSYTYSSDKAQSIFDLTSKLSFLLIPFLLTGYRLDSRRMADVVMGFSTGIGIAGIHCISRGVFTWMQTHATTSLFYHKLVAGYDANAVYMAWYVMAATFLLLFYHHKDKKFQALRLVLLCILTLFFILLSCRLLLVLALILLPIAMLQKRTNAFSRVKVLAIVASMLILLAAVSVTHNPIRQRFAEVLSRGTGNAYLSDYHGQDPTGNLVVRLFLWRVGTSRIAQNHNWIAGCGNGDAHLEINEGLRSLGITNMQPEGHTSLFYDIDLHNMYLESMLMLGIPGLMVFIIIVFLPFFYWRRINWGWRAFHIACALFFAQEAALQTQAGIIFYSLFTVLFWRHVKAKEIEQSLASTLPDY